MQIKLNRGVIISGVYTEKWSTVQQNISNEAISLLSFLNF